MSLDICCIRKDVTDFQDCGVMVGRQWVAASAVGKDSQGQRTLAAPLPVPARAMEKVGRAPVPWSPSYLLPVYSL